MRERQKMRKYSIDFLYLLFLDLLLAYLYFKVMLNSLHIIDISLMPYIGLSLLTGVAINNIKLKIKKNKINTLSYFVLLIILIGVFYIVLFNYYHYDFLHEKDAWQFSLIFILMAIGEAFYYFFSYEELKEEQESSPFSIFKKKNSSDESDRNLGTLVSDDESKPIE